LEVHISLAVGAGRGLVWVRAQSRTYLAVARKRPRLTSTRVHLQGPPYPQPPFLTRAGPQLAAPLELGGAGFAAALTPSPSRVRRHPPPGLLVLSAVAHVHTQ
jgi:hypothetical protein